MENTRFRKAYPFSWVIFYFSCICMGKGINVSGGKLDEIVLRRSDEIFNLSISKPQVDGNGKVTSPDANANANATWTNEGFLAANATQISTSLGDKIDGRTKLLLATKASTLTTTIRNFEHTFLSIKFAWIIGHTAPAPPPPPAPAPAPISSSTSQETDADPSTSPEDASEDVDTSTTELPAPAPHPPPPPLPLALALPPPPVIILLQASPTTPVPTTTTTTSTPTILKLNTHTADEPNGHRVIEIAIDSGVLPKPPAPTAAPTTRTTRKPKSIKKKRRALDSEEISQIHQILTMTKSSGKKKEKEKDGAAAGVAGGSGLNSIVAGDAGKAEQEQDEAQGQGPVGVKPAPAPAPAKPPPRTAKKLPYETWRASMDKSFRPPGFYVTVEDRVVFDNWVGVWQSPSVMGRSILPSKKGVWNETNLMVQFDETPDQVIKINFEWEPTEATAFLFLSNITISTYAARSRDMAMAAAATQGNSTANKTGNETQKAAAAPTNSLSNNNITLYIVVKSPPHDGVGEKEDLDAATKKAAKEKAPPPPPPSPKKKRKFKTTPKSKSKPASNEGAVELIDSETVEVEYEDEPEKVKHVKPSLTKNEAAPTPSNTALIVACVTGVLSFVVLAFLVQKKMALSRRNIRGC